MPKKTAFIGAGSYGFTYKLVCDILCKPTLADCAFSFMDVDPARLENVKILCESHFKSVKYGGKAVFTTDMEAALDGADFVVNLVKIGFFAASELDMEIPKKYGLYQTVGDTCGVAGISRGLRTMLFNERLLQTMERVSSPGAVVLNYTNPQHMCVMHAAVTSRIPFIGLCHSVQGTTRNMAKYVEEDYSSVDFKTAGINHLNFILSFTKDEQDLYPRFREAVKNEKAGCTDEEQIFATFGSTRIDLMNRFGYMVTESSNHLAEYLPYYLRTAELRKQYGIEIDRYRRNIEKKEKNYKELVERAKAGTLVPPGASVEYGSQIMDAMVTGLPCKVYANVINKGLISNLPEYACVEVACLVDRAGVQPCRFGEMPWQLAMLCDAEVQVHKLAVEAVLRRDPHYVYWAMLADPVAASVMTPDQIKACADEILVAQKEYLPNFA